MSRKRKQNRAIEHFKVKHGAVYNLPPLSKNYLRYMITEAEIVRQIEISRKLIVSVKEIDEILAMHSATSSPPSARRSFWVDMCLPTGEAEEAHDAIEDMMPKWIERYGPFRANLLRRKTLVWIVCGQHLNRTLRLLERVRKVIWSPPA